MSQSQPCYRADRNLWYVPIGSRQVSLGEHPSHLPPPVRKKGRQRGAWKNVPDEILAAYHRVMLDHGLIKEDGTPTPPADDVVTVPQLLDEYLTWLRLLPHKAQRTVRWYEKYLQSFVESLEDLALPVTDLTPSHVTHWLTLHPGWTSGRRGAITSIQRAMNWSAREGLLKAMGVRSPLAGMEKPPQGRREQLVSEAELNAILTNARDECFQDLVFAAWDTGARPDELFTVEASFFDATNGVWIFPSRSRRANAPAGSSTSLTEWWR